MGTRPIFWYLGILRSITGLRFFFLWGYVSAFFARHRLCVTIYGSLRSMMGFALLPTYEKLSGEGVRAEVLLECHGGCDTSCPKSFQVLIMSVDRPNTPMTCLCDTKQQRELQDGPLYMRVRNNSVADLESRRQTVPRQSQKRPPLIICTRPLKSAVIC